MINPYSYLDMAPDYVMAEFTVFPAYRRRHIGCEAATHILEAFRGRWEIKYNEKNTGAKELWNRVTARYHPTSHRFSDTETVLVFSTR